MALRLGDITFGLGADTKGLQKSVGLLSQFSKVVDKTAANQTKNAQQTTRALTRQERAIRSALQQTLNLNAALRRAGAAPEAIARNSNAFRALTRVLTSGRVETVSFARAQDRFRASLGKSRRELSNLTSSKTEKGLRSINTLIRNLESSSVLAVGPLSRVGSSIRAIGAITSRATLAFAAGTAALVGLGVGFAKFTKEAVRVRLEFEQIEARLIAAVGTSAAAGQEFNFIADVASNLGLALGQTAKQYSSLAAAAEGTELAGDPVRELFLGTAEAAAALRLSTDDTGGALRALQQIISKGTVQAEELRGQFGERIPGAFKIAADALGVTTQQLNKLLKDGQVLATDLLPKLGRELRRRFGENAQKATESLTASLGRVNTEFFLLIKSLDDLIGTSSAFQAFVDGLVEGLRTIRDLLGETSLGTQRFIGDLDEFIRKETDVRRASKTVTDGLISDTQNRIKALKDELETLDKRRNALGVAGPSLGEQVTSAEDQRRIEEITSQVSALESALIDILNLPPVSPLGGKAGGEASKEFETAEKKVKGLISQLKVLREQQGVSSRGLGAILEVERLGEARKILAEVPSSERAGLAALLKQVGIQAGTTEQALAALITQVQVGDQELDALTSKLQATPDILSDLNDQLDRLRAETEALQGGADAFEQYEKLTAQTDKIRAFREELEKTALSQERINERVAEFTTVLEENDEARETFEEQMKTVDSLVKAFDRGFDRIGSSITEAFVKGEDAALTFQSVVEGVLSELIQTVLDFALLSPLKGGLESVLKSVFTGGGLGGGLDFTGGGFAIDPANVAFRQGGAMSGGRLVKMAKGAVLGGPTLFPLAKGAAIARETARDEAVVPLTRTNSGDLGVSAVGMGSNVVVNVINNAGADVSVNRRQTTGGAEEIDVIIDKAFAKVLTKGGESYNAIQNMFNVNTRLTGGT